MYLSKEYIFWDCRGLNVMRKSLSRVPHCFALITFWYHLWSVTKQTHRWSGGLQEENPYRPLPWFSLSPLTPCATKDQWLASYLCGSNSPSMSKGKREEMQQVKAVLQENNCPLALSVNVKERWQQNKLRVPQWFWSTSLPKEMVAY